jgi:hypothetical protein
LGVFFQNSKWILKKSAKRAIIQGFADHSEESKKEAKRDESQVKPGRSLTTYSR